MALIVEDGSAPQGAESYLSVDDASTYHQNRGNALWATLAQEQMEAALRRATDYLVQVYRDRWKGGRAHWKQSLDWPRVGVVTRDFVNGGPGYGPFVVDYKTIPQELKNATAELAFRAAQGPLMADTTTRVTSEQVGTIKVTYDPTSPQNPQFLEIDAILSPYLQTQGGSIRLQRC